MRWQAGYGLWRKRVIPSIHPHKGIHLGLPAICGRNAEVLRTSRADLIVADMSGLVGG